MARGRSRAVNRVLGVRGRRNVGRQEGAFNRSVTANRRSARSEGIIERGGRNQPGAIVMRGRRRFQLVPLTSGPNSRLMAVNDS
jgi:hypothetical protein